MDVYIAKSIYDEYKECIYTAIESLYLTDCPFSIQFALGYLYGALNLTFTETYSDTVFVDINEW